MSKCRNEVFLGKIKQEKLTKETEVTFNVIDALPDCRRIVTKNYISSEEIAATWEKFDVPHNQLECDATPCGNSGTLYLTNANGEVVYSMSGTDWANGIITFYVTGTTSAQVTVGNSDFSNADVYTVTLSEAGDDGYKVGIVNLSATPTSVVSGGWTPSDINYIKIKLTSAGAGVSSISIFESVEDMYTSNVVKISCLSGIDGDTSIDVAEADCWDEGYDTSSSPTLERTITGKMLTPNYWLLNPLLGKGTATEGFEDTTIEVTLATTYVALPDFYDDECSYAAASLIDPCNTTDSMFDRVMLPNVVALHSNEFQVVKSSNSQYFAYFASSMIGKTIAINYPKKATVEELVADEKNLGTRKVRMSFPYYTSDGVKYVKVFNNVLVTSFPESITNEEAEFEFTVNIRRDSEGHYYRIYRIV